MSETLYSVDGQQLTAEECIKRFSPRENAVGPRVQACLDWLEGQRVLDIGCRFGSFVDLAKRLNPNMSIHGCDYFPDNIEVGKLVFPDSAANLKVSSAYNLDYPDNSFDCCLLQATIEHLEQAALAVKEANRVLRPGGTFIVTTDNPISLYFIKRFLKVEMRNRIATVVGKQKGLPPDIFRDSVEYARHVYSWIPSTLLTMMVVNGFEYVDHAFVPSSGGFLKKNFLRLFPFLGEVQALKVRKTSDAPRRFV